MKQQIANGFMQIHYENKNHEVHFIHMICIHQFPQPNNDAQIVN